MNDDLAQSAISLALNGEWDEAVKANLQILKAVSDDTDALNRLARAYAETGDVVKAKKTAEKVLKIDSVNPIAIKCLEKWKSLKKVDKGSSSKAISTEAFLEESGKTKIVALIHPGDEITLAKLDSGDEVSILCHPHRVSIVDASGKYIGRLPDDLSARLRKLIKLGNVYHVVIKSIEGREVKVFIKEVEKSANAKDFASFPTEKIEYTSFTPPELVHKDEPIMEDLIEEPTD